MLSVIILDIRWLDEESLEITPLAAKPKVEAMPLLTPENHNFEERCTAPGVIACIGFDDAESIKSYLHPAGVGEFRGFLDDSIKASGHGSLRFDIPSKSSANSSGYWMYNFGDALGQSFGERQAFYIQFRQRFDSPMLTNKQLFSGGGWKQVVFHSGNRTCANMEITTNNLYFLGIPTMYTHCGARALRISIPPSEYLLQQRAENVPGYDCFYSKAKRKDLTECGTYKANQWMTFYYEVKIGDWGQANSSVRAYMAYEGEPYMQFVNISDHVLSYNQTNKDTFTSITLLNYNTGKKMIAEHPPAATWYDELIISTQPIEAPY